MKMKFLLTYDDDRTEEVAVSPLAIIGWEKWSGRKMSDMSSSGGGFGMEDMVFQAWEQTRLQGGTTDEFETWAASLADIDPASTTDPTSGGEEASAAP